MILEEYLEIVPVGKNCSYYKNLGYEVHKGVPIKIKIEDVSDGCNALENIKCDCCGKIEKRKHRAIIDTRNSYGKDLCVKCSKKEMQEKIKKINIKKYGVEYPMQSKEIKRKAKESTLEHYGVEFSFQNEEINKKARDSFKERHGVNNPLQDKKIKEKLKKTNLKRYGVENVFANEEIKEKIKNTNLEKYGVENPSQSEEIREKMVKTLLENHTTPTSKPQVELFNLCKEVFPNYLVELNAPLSKLMLDIKIVAEDGVKIDLEYDGWFWHRDKKKDAARDNVVRKYGYKVIRIKSQTLLPSKEQLKESVDYLVKSNHHFKEIILSDWRG